MLMKMRGLCGIVFLMMCLMASSIFATDNGLTQIKDTTFEKVYVSQDQVMITADGIFFLNSLGELAPTSVIAFDSYGLYVFKRVPVCLLCREPLQNGVCKNRCCGQYNR